MPRLLHHPPQRRADLLAAGIGGPEQRVVVRLIRALRPLQINKGCRQIAVHQAPGFRRGKKGIAHHFLELPVKPPHQQRTVHPCQAQVGLQVEVQA